MTKDEALRLALEALEYFSDTSPNMAGKAHAEDAITAIKAALLSRSDGEAKDEPEHSDELTIAYMSGLHRGKELAQRKPLTDEERFKMWSETDFRGSGGQYDWFVEGIRAAEAAHGIKGEA
jgi:hypothetical protein